jgi:hypothetical protein
LQKPFFNKSIKKREKKTHCPHYSFVLCICQEEEEEEEERCAPTTPLMLFAFQSIKTSSAQILSVSGCTLTQRGKNWAGHFILSHIKFSSFFSPL